MKKQGEVYLKIISIVLVAVVASYVLFSVLLSRGSSYAIEVAASCEVGDGQTVSGFVVRSEKILLAEQAVVVCERTEGEHVGSGQSVATAYPTAEARAQRQRQTALQAQLEQLQYAAEGTGGSDNAALDEQIKSLLLQTVTYAAQQKLDAASAPAVELQPRVLRRCVDETDTAHIQAKISEILESISRLSVQTAAATPITVSSSGYYSEVVDGYETIFTPERILTMSLAELRSAENLRQAVSNQAIGRLALGQTWYFVTEVPTQRLEGYAVGGRLTVSFAAESLQELSMTIERIGEDTDGSCILVLSCDRLLQDVTALRRQTADIVFSSYSGLHVPAQALYYSDGSAGVYVLEGVRANWKPVNILYEYNNGYIVELDKSSTGNLWPEDQIILTSEDIYDGKVMGNDS